MDCKQYKSHWSIWIQSDKPSRKKLNKSGNKDLDQAVFKWLKNARSNNIPVNGNLIKGKVLNFAKSLELNNFWASDGRIDERKQRHNVTWRAVWGEENAGTLERTASWNETYLTTILIKCELKDIYNADQSGFFNQALPNKSLHYKGERCSGGKHSKVRLTGLASGNGMKKSSPCL